MTQSNDEKPKKKGGLRFSTNQDNEDFFRFLRVKGRAPKDREEINQWNREESEDD